MKEKIALLIKNALNDEISLDDIIIDIPKDKINGDYSSNVALKNAKKMNKNPMDLAESIKDNIHESFITKIEVCKPGFINFYVTKDYLLDNINNVLELGSNYGNNDFGKNKKINIEFVSANPTGILHMGNARGGAYGDSLARIMTKCGFDVTKEYYLNDNGNQINNLGLSIRCKYLKLCGIDEEFPEKGYPGKEIDLIANNLYEKYKDTLKDNDLSIYKEEGVKYLSSQIFKDLNEYRINYDVVTSEKDIYNRYPIKDQIDNLRNNGYIYEKDNATYFASSKLLDSEDHVLIKADGNYTYLLPDISYHIDKLNRGFDKLIDVLGTDHHGYIPRLISAIKANGYDEEKLEVKLLQLVRIVSDGKVASMHKRSGNVITLKDLMDEVGVNAARYYFSRYSLDTQMDFDIKLAKSKTSENPVFYVCYAYARICSILNKYENINKIDKYKFINNEEAYNMLESIYKYPEIVKNACKNEMVHIITNYVYELASNFHLFYEKHKVITDDENETMENLNMLLCVKIVLFDALNLIGVIPEERM